MEGKMANQKTLQKYCESALSILNSQYGATKVLRHPSTTGSVREQIIKDFLSAHLPELITVISGQIFDAKENYSRQQDIVLVLKSMPRLPFASGSDLIFQEGVVATIEIKTTLNGSALEIIGENIASVRKLESSVGATAQFGVTHSWPPCRILTAVVAYGGSSLESLRSMLTEMRSDARPDLLLDFSKGLLVQNHGLLLRENGGAKYVLIDNPAEGFKIFLTFLTEITGTLSSRGVQWRNYC